MRLRKPYEHGRYDAHFQSSAFSGNQCPGGEFLTEDALVIERNELGLWPKWAIDKLRFDVAALAECSAEEILDALREGSK